MNRYKKANEGIHAPEDLKEKAARPAGKRSYAPWMGAVAAVLVIAMIGGIAMWPKQPESGGPIADNPAPLSGEGQPVGPRSAPGGENGDALIGGQTPAEAAVTYGSSYDTCALALAAYPEMAPYPRDDEYVTDNGDFDYHSWDEAYSVWMDSRKALRSEWDHYPEGFMHSFIAASAGQFLTGAGEDNRVYSPLNVYMALSMLAETTGGGSRQQILNLLGADSMETVREQAAALWKDTYRDDGTVTSILGNSLWLRDGMTYSQKTLDTLAENYYASSFSGEMGSEEYNQALRDWINTQTKGLLSQQADALEMDAATVLALASTIYFKAAWNGEFSKERTETDIFHAPGGDVEADFMHRTMESAYYWGEHFAAVQLTFQDGGSMWLILPDEGYSLEQLLDSGEAMDFLLADKYGKYDEETGEYTETWPDRKYLNINLSMPKFDASSDLDLIDGLMELGVTDVFDMNASNFDPLDASTDEPLYLSQAKHAARVKVDEEGCEAAAYTVIMVACGAAMPPDEEVDFTLDRPFLFAINADWTGLPLFIGAVNQPNG